MRFEVGPGPQDFRVFLDDGTEVTKEFHVSAFHVSMYPNEFPKVELTLEDMHVTMKAHEDNVVAEIKTWSPAVSGTPGNPCAEIPLYSMEKLSPKEIETIQFNVGVGSLTVNNIQPKKTQTPEAILESFKIG